MPKAPRRIVFDLGNKIRVSPPIFSDPSLDLQPGDLSEFVPYGNGVYGYQNRKGSNPFTSAPSQEACGGVIYFGNGVSKADFEALMRITEVRPDHKDFAVFTAESKQPGKYGYLAQMRVVSKFGLRHLFHAITDAEHESFVEQEMTIVEALWLFIQQERQRWGTSFLQDGEKGLEGLFGGDGDCAREELAFGFMLENDYYDVYRIWSRAWLVTK